MNCKKCGSPLGPNEVFCKECGTSVDVLVPGTPGVTVTTPAPATPAVQPTPTVSAPAPVSVAPTTSVSPTQTQVVPTPTQPMGVAPATPAVQPMNNTPTNTPPLQNSGKKGSKAVIVLILLVVIVGVAAVLYFTVFNKKDDSASNTSNSNSSSQPSSENNSANNSNSNVNTNSNSNATQATYSINHGGYTYKIPLQYQTKLSESGVDFLISDGENWVASLCVVPNTYDILVSQKAVLQQQFTDAGYTNITSTEETINGRKHFVFKANKNGQNRVLGFTKASVTEVFLYEIVTSDGIDGTQYLSILDTISSTATPENNGFGIELSGEDLGSIFIK